MIRSEVLDICSINWFGVRVPSDAVVCRWRSISTGHSGETVGDVGLYRLLWDGGFEEGFKFRSADPLVQLNLPDRWRYRYQSRLN